MPEQVDTTLAALVDVDDLYHPDQIEAILVPLHTANPAFRITCFTIPNRFGPITPDLAARYPWITFAIHGWEHAHFECLEWTYEKAKTMIQRALDMGYAPIFRPPNWLCDEDLERACRDLDVILCHHVDDQPHTEKLMCWPGPKSLRPADDSGPRWLHSHLPGIANFQFHLQHDTRFTSAAIAAIPKFLTFPDVYLEVPHVKPDPK